MLILLLLLVATGSTTVVESWSNNVGSYPSRFLRYQRPHHQNIITTTAIHNSKSNNNNNNQGEEEHQQDSEPEEEDWRDVRAKLVLQYRKEKNLDDGGNDDDDSNDSMSSSSSSASKSKSSSWIYESGDVIEEGSLILSHPIQDFAYGGLRQQYFHKCVVLVIEHNPAVFTKGIILNRPTIDQTIMDDRNVEWDVWFGGDVQGLDSDQEEFTCLHQLDSSLARDLSIPIVKDIQCTPWEIAQFLVEQGEATINDFWLGCGYAGWGPGQLQNELERGNWLMVAADEKSILDLFLKKKNAEEEEEKEVQNYNDFETGVNVWKQLMARIGQKDLLELSQDFEDTMLRGWIYERLTTHSFREGTKGRRQTTATNRTSTSPRSASFVAPVRNPSIGNVIRAKHPILLNEQFFHQSIVLILDKNKVGTIGVILNLPSSNIVRVNNHDVPLRFGGRYGTEEGKPEIWLHYGNRKLIEANVGSPIVAGDQYHGDDKFDDEKLMMMMVWKCQREDAETAIEMGLADPTDFLVISGFTLWKNFINHDADITNMPPVTASDPNNAELDTHFTYAKEKIMTPEIWFTLTRQQSLENAKNDIQRSLAKNMELACNAWVLSGGSVDGTSSTDGGGIDSSVTLQEKKSFRTSTDMIDLANLALQRWVNTFLMNNSKR